MVIYTFYRNRIRIYEDCRIEYPIIHPRRNANLICARVKDGTRRIVPEIEGAVYANKLYLNERDDQKAFDCFLQSMQDKIIELEEGIIGVQDQIKKLYLAKGDLING